MGANQPKARHAKSKARLARYEELASKEFQERNETNEIYIPPGPRLGELVIEVTGLSKGYGERLLMDNVNFKLPRAASSASSDPTAPARPPCSAC